MPHRMALKGSNLLLLLLLGKVSGLSCSAEVQVGMNHCFIVSNLGCMYAQILLVPSMLIGMTSLW